MKISIQFLINFIIENVKWKINAKIEFSEWKLRVFHAKTFHWFCGLLNFALIVCLLSWNPQSVFLDLKMEKFFYSVFLQLKLFTCSIEGKLFKLNKLDILVSRMATSTSSSTWMHCVVSTQLEFENVFLHPTEISSVADSSEF